MFRFIRLLLLLTTASLIASCGGKNESSWDTPPDTVAPSRPGGLVANPMGATGVSLSWGAATDNMMVVSYVVSRDGTQVATSTTTSYIDSGLTPATTYSYRVAAVDEAGNMSPSSPTANVTTGASSDTTPPSQPTGLTATAAGAVAANLSWNASTDNVRVTGYIVSRNGVQIATLAATSFADSGLAPATTYTYTVVALDAAGNQSSPASASVATGTPADTTPPSQPAALTGTPTGGTGATLSWSASTDDVGVTGYVVTRNGVQIATPTAISFTDSGLTPATTYSYTVAARDAAGNRSTAASVSVATADTLPPSTPTGLTGAASGSTGANLSWNASADNVGVTGYIVSRNGVQIATPAATSFADTGLAPTTTYTYAVVARDAAGNGSTAAVVSVTTGPAADTTPPSQPTGLTGAASGSTGANLSWNASTDKFGVTGYIVTRNGTQVGTPATTSFADTGLTAGTTYSYTVVARDAAGNRSTAASVSVTTAPTLPPPPVVSGTFFVATNGSDSNSCTIAQTAATAKKTIQGGFSCLGPGAILVIRDGTYGGAGNDFTGVPNGSAGNYVTIKAENDGNVIITGDLDMDNTNTFVQVEGLRFHTTSQKNILGNHLRFFRNEFMSGCSTGNCMNTVIGTNDVTTTADILLEDNWFHGPGGRYNLLVYNSQRVVVRRAIIRHDAGWTDGGTQDPEAGLNFYNSRDSAAQNVIVLDSNLKYATWAASFYAVKNSSSAIANQNNIWDGCIALIGADIGFRHDTESSAGNTIRNTVFWDTVNGGISLGQGGFTSFSIDHVTMGLSKLTASGDFFGGIGKFSGSAGPVITNTIIRNFPGADLSGVSATFFDTFANGSASTGTGRLTVDPLANGLKYLARIEAASTLSTAGSGGGQIGAQIVNRIGTAGTLQGETGWNTDTGAALWPFPNEARIKKEMCTDAGVTRGFCSDTSLTNYIMNYLGNGNPFP